MLVVAEAGTDRLSMLASLPTPTYRGLAHEVICGVNWNMQENGVTVDVVAAITTYGPRFGTITAKPAGAGMIH